MENNRCRNCGEPLEGEAGCGKCGAKAASAEGGGSPATPAPVDKENVQAQPGAALNENQPGSKPTPNRNLRPPTPPPPPPKAEADGAANAAAGSVQPPDDARRPELKENKEEDKEEQQQSPPPRGADDRPKAMADQFFRQFVNSKGDKNLFGQNVYSKARALWRDSAAPSQEQNVTSQGNGNTLAQNLWQIWNISGDSRAGEAGSGGAAAGSLIDITAALSSKDRDTPEFESGELARHATQLRAARVLLLSCADEKVALGAAYALLDEMGVNENEECRRGLDFGSDAQKKFEQITHLLSRRADEERCLTAVVVGAYGSGSKQFLDWLVRVSHFGAQGIRDGLSASGLVLVCLFDAAYMERAEKDLRAEGTRLNFACWKISFLHPLLKHHFPGRHAELEERLLRQRGEGKWERDETKFCQEVREYVEADRLPEEIEAREQGEAPPPDLPPLRGGKAVEDALLYTAACFPDLTLREFDEVVGMLLEGKMTTVTVKSVRTNKDGERETFDAEVQRPLAELWAESPDEYLDACRLEMSAQSDAATAVNFASGKLRDDVKRLMSTKHRMYALRQFQAVEARGLLFHPSPRVSEKMMQLCVEMALTHPDVVGRDWFYKMVTAIGAEGGPALPLPTGLARPEAYAYERVAQLVRQMLEEPRLEETAAGFLRQLMDAGRHEALLEIMRGLQFAPKIKEFGWIKRVLDEGREEARQAARRLLYGYIKKSDLYSLMRALESWLPKPDQPPEAYAPSALAALRLAAEHCLETRVSFDPADYGAWPSRHPLFAFEDAAAAADGLGRLFRWMLNPAMERVFEEMRRELEELGFEAEDGFDYRPTTFVGESVVEWSFVLRGPEGAAGAGAPAPAAGERLTAAAVHEIMVEQLVKATDREQRNELLLYWEEVRDFLGFVLDRRGYLEYLLDRDEQKAVRWKRELVRDLIKRFRELSWQHRLSAPAEAVRVEQGVM